MPATPGTVSVSPSSGIGSFSKNKMILTLHFQTTLLLLPDTLLQQAQVLPYLTKQTPAVRQPGQSCVFRPKAIRSMCFLGTYSVPGAVLYLDHLTESSQQPQKALPRPLTDKESHTERPPGSSQGKAGPCIGVAAGEHSACLTGPRRTPKERCTSAGQCQPRAGFPLPGSANPLPCNL